MNFSGDSAIIIRELESTDEMRSVERLQKEIWGIPDLEVVPHYQLIAAKESGGVLLGAFDGDELAGFVYGFVGFERGVTVHHSHMLAVKPEYRSQNLGVRLKTAQRQQVLEQGITIMTWTFDPLQSLNAYFNFNKLGVVADRYYTDFYGTDVASFLHRNGTDRLWVSWHLTSKRVNESLNGDGPSVSMENIPVLVAVCETGAPLLLRHSALAERIAIEIPKDISLLEKENRELAHNWRLATRRVFVEAIGAGFVVEAFVRKREAARDVGVYILNKNPDGIGW